MANILYKKQKQQKSLDNGVTWIDTGEYRVGDIIENPSNCTSDNTKQCRWVELPESEGYYCDGYSKYTMQVEECTENGLIWTRTGNSQRGNTLIESNSTGCGYVKPDTPTGGTYECEPIPIGNFSYKYYSNCLCTPESYIAINGTNYTIDTSGIIADPVFETTKTYSLSDFGVSSLNSLNLSGLCGCCWITSMFDTSNVTDMSNMFRGNNAQECINLSTMNTSSANDMSYMFYQWAKLKNIYLNNWNTSNVTNMSYMFGGCPNLISLDVSSFDTSNVVNMAGMFASCRKLTSLDLSNFDTSNVTNMSELFYHCSGLTALDLSNFDTSKVTDMSYMFYYCNSLTSLDLSSWDVSKVTNVERMFEYLTSLETLNLSGWDVLANLDLRSFMYCPKLTTIYMYGCNQASINNLTKYKPTKATIVY